MFEIGKNYYIVVKPINGYIFPFSTKLKVKEGDICKFLGKNKDGFLGFMVKNNYQIVTEYRAKQMFAPLDLKYYIKKCMKEKKCL